MWLLRSQDAQYEEHFLVHDSAWSKNLTVEADATVGHPATTTPQDGDQQRR